jgi:hypothetical protein
VCGAAGLADQLNDEVIDAINLRKIPPAFQEDLQARSNELVNTINCPSTSDEDDDEEESKQDEKDKKKEKNKKKEKDGEEPSPEELVPTEPLPTITGGGG